MIVRSLPYDISVLILKCISLKVLYVSIFPRFFISLIAFVFSKIRKTSYPEISSSFSTFGSINDWLVFP